VALLTRHPIGHGLAPSGAPFCCPTSFSSPSRSALVTYALEDLRLDGDWDTLVAAGCGGVCGRATSLIEAGSSAAGSVSAACSIREVLRQDGTSRYLSGAADTDRPYAPETGPWPRQ
jgi:hypothetical protein